MKQVVIITNENAGVLAVEYDGHTTTIREHVKYLHLGPQATRWLIDALYKMIGRYTDEKCQLASPSGTTALLVYRDVEHIWIQATNNRFAGSIDKFRNVLTAIEQLHSCVT